MDTPVKVKRRKTFRGSVQSAAFPREEWEIVTFADEPTYGAWRRFMGLCAEEGGSLRQNFRNKGTPSIDLLDAGLPIRAAASYERRLK